MPFFSKKCSNLLFRSSAPKSVLTFLGREPWAYRLSKAETTEPAVLSRNGRTFTKTSMATRRNLMFLLYRDNLVKSARSTSTKSFTPYAITLLLWNFLRTNLFTVYVFSLANTLLISALENLKVPSFLIASLSLFIPEKLPGRLGSV